MAPRQPDYANLWFKAQWMRALARVIGVLGVAVIFAVWLMVKGLFGDDAAQTFITAIAFALPVAAVACGVAAVCQVFIPRKRDTTATCEKLRREPGFRKN